LHTYLSTRASRLRGPELHWWLTGFKWGVMSDPSQLSVDLSIKLKDDAMRDAF